MRYSIASVVALLATVALTSDLNGEPDCGSSLPCVKTYPGTFCNGPLGPDTPLEPFCNHECMPIEGGFASIKIKGDGIDGTNCVAYADEACTEELGETGNNVHGYECLNMPGAKAMKCYFGC